MIRALDIQSFIFLIRSHATMIMMTLDSWVENLDDLDLVVDAVLRLGQTHAGIYLSIYKLYLSINIYESIYLYIYLSILLSI